MPKVILASGSKRRKRLLSKLIENFEVDPSGYEEEKNLNMEPVDLVKYIAIRKAEGVAKGHDAGIIIAADTMVFHKGRSIGKPENKKEAKRILKGINGETFDVISGLVVVDMDKNNAYEGHSATKVKMKKLSEKEIEAYIKTGEPLGKAGAFAIQERGSAFVEDIEGSFYNVVGLPLNELYELLRKANLSVF